MELDQTEFEQYVVKAHEEVNDYIEKEARRFYKEQPSSWRHKPQLLPTYVQTINFNEQYILYRFFEKESQFDAPNWEACLKIVVWPGFAPSVVAEVRKESRPYYSDIHMPLVPGLLAVMVKYFLDAGYTPLVDTKEK